MLATDMLQLVADAQSSWQASHVKKHSLPVKLQVIELLVNAQQILSLANITAYSSVVLVLCHISNKATGPDWSNHFRIEHKL